MKARGCSCASAPGDFQVVAADTVKPQIADWVTFCQILLKVIGGIAVIIPEGVLGKVAEVFDFPPVGQKVAVAVEVAELDINAGMLTVDGHCGG